jgi:type I restriction enzyme M protein
MLDSDTRRRIDSARDILVGKVPDPKTQVEQITFAMIYKFMDDMDQQSVGLGGAPAFFANGYEQYAWSRLMDKRLSGLERLDLYVRALEQMAQNPHIPALFRDIFKGAFLPYRDSETLSLFLKEMDSFRYDHSEDLGDAYEYLLSIFASQGKAGQFRTPRHIIDFIVQCVDPDKTDTVLDPACGTAGFLISAFKHIEGKYKDSPLSPDEKKRLTQNFVGYDISPDMVRLSRVNMYLHQFPNPTIHEYDTLTSDDRWDETYDVILANPPFMTPKGGIRPHKRFAVRANRSEVLFVDYIAEHLNAGGRAGVIVPEGIIFQNGNAYKALRKFLVEAGFLYAVVSLPAGVFNPYSGVKTSILLLDRTLARQADSILFIKIEADGYDLGAQRRQIERNDVPEALRLVKAFQADPTAPLPEGSIAEVVTKQRLAKDSVYNLSAERYSPISVVSPKWPMVRLGDFFSTITPHMKLQKEDYSSSGKFPIIDQGQTFISGWTDNELAVIDLNKPLIIFGDHTCSIKYVDFPFAQGADGIKIIYPSQEYLPKFLYFLLKQNGIEPEGYKRHFSKLKEMKVPKPTLEVQQEILNEVEGYKKVIDGARQVVENYKPTIPIDPSWPMIELIRCSEVISGQSPEGKYYNSLEQGLPFYQGKLDFGDTFIGPPNKWTTQITKIAQKGDILMSVRAPVGPVNLATQSICIGRGLAAIRPDEEVIETFYLFNYLRSIESQITGNSGSTFASINRNDIGSILIPLPSMEKQREIVSELKRIQSYIDGNKQMIYHMESKVTATIQRVWQGG